MVLRIRVDSAWQVVLRIQVVLRLAGGSPARRWAWPGRWAPDPGGLGLAGGLWIQVVLRLAGGLWIQVVLCLAGGLQLEGASIVALPSVTAGPFSRLTSSLGPGLQVSLPQEFWADPGSTGLVSALPVAQSGPVPHRGGHHVLSAPPACC